MATLDDILELYSGSPDAARNQAASLAQAIRGRRALGQAGLITGDTAGMGALGKELTGDADRLETSLIGAAQHRAQQDVQRQHYDALQKHYAAIEANQAARNAATMSEVVPVKAEGGTQMVPKHQEGFVKGPVLPLTIGAGGASRGAEPDYDAQTIDRWAQQYNDTGKLPEGITPRFSPKTVKLITSKATSLPGGDKPLATARADAAANKTSVGKQQVLFDLTKSWEDTGRQNLAVLRQLSTELANTGSKWVNAPVRKFLEGAAGDPRQTKFKAAHAAVVNEYAKILSGSTGAGGVTEGARHEAEQMLPLDATPEQIAAAADVLDLDAGNRLKALESGLASTRARTSAATAQPAAPSHGAAPAAGGTIKVKRKSDGKVGSMPAEKFNPEVYEKIQ